MTHSKTPGLSVSAAFAGCVLLSFALGSIHAFSVLLQPFELSLAVNRAEASLLYSFALVMLTVAVLLGHRIYGRISSPLLVFVIGIMAAFGVLLAAWSRQWLVAMLGYSICFGFANGLGYGFALQFSAQVAASRKGMAMAAVTAVYAFGAFLFVFILQYAKNAGGLATALYSLCLALLLLISASALLMKLSGRRYAASGGVEQRRNVGNASQQWFLWGAYGLACLSGLMVIGHATGVMQAVGAERAMVTLAPALIAVANMVGGLSAGILADRLPVERLLKILPAIGAGALLMTVFGHTISLTLLGLLLVGASYGAIIAVYPVAVYQRVGAEASARIYGRVFTAWGLAGLLGPWLAGMMYDYYREYRVALLVAAGAAVVSILLVRKLHSRPGNMESAS